MLVLLCLPSSMSCRQLHWTDLLRLIYIWVWRWFDYLMLWLLVQAAAALPFSIVMSQCRFTGEVLCVPADRCLHKFSALSLAVGRPRTSTAECQARFVSNSKATATSCLRR